MPAILFVRDNENLDIWVENPSKISRAYPHADIEENLKRRFLELNEIGRLRMTSAVVLEDWEGHTYLSIKEWLGKLIRIKVVEGSNDVDVPEVNIDTVEDLVKRYGIHKVTSQVAQKVTKDNQTISWSRDEEILTLDIVGQYREASFLRSYQERYEMTAAQFLRFRTRVNSAKRANQPLNYDPLAAEIIADE